jgi:hypothetical protein
MSPARASPTIGPMGAKPFLQTAFSLLFGSGPAKNETTFIPLSVPSTPRPDVSAPPQLTMPQNSESKNPNEDEHIQPQATLSETTPHFAAKSSISPESQLDPYLAAWVQRLQKLETETSALQSSAQAVRATVIARATNGIGKYIDRCSISSMVTSGAPSFAYSSRTQRLDRNALGGLHATGYRYIDSERCRR